MQKCYIFSYYKLGLQLDEVIGNTAALMMIRKKVFEKCGMFNEEYQSCFEDVELNVKCVLSGYKNYYSGNIVSYHFESQTRNDDKNKMDKLISDYNNNLIKIIYSNLTRLGNYIMEINKK